MLNFSKTLLVRCMALIISGAGSSTVVLADDQSVLPTIVVTAETETSVANGQLDTKATLGALGNKNIVDTPFTVSQYTSQLIEQQQAATIGAVLKNDASIRATTNQGHLNENFKLRGFDVNHEDIAYNGFFGVAPYGRIPTEFLDSVTVLKGPNALVAGVAPTGSVGGVIIANSKRADQEVTRVFSSFEDSSYYQSGFDVARRFGAEQEFGVRINGVYGDGEHSIEGMNDRHATGAIAADYNNDRLNINFDAYAIRENRDGGSPAMVAMGGNGSINQVIAAPKGNLNFFPKLKGNMDGQFIGLSGQYKFSPELNAFAGVGYAEKQYSGHLFGTRMIVRQTDGSATSQYYRVGSKEQNTAANAGIESKFVTGAVQHTVGLRADYLSRTYTQHTRAPSAAFVTNLYHPSHNGDMPTAYPVIAPLGDNQYMSYTLTDQMSMFEDKLQLIVGARYQDIDTKNLQQNTAYSENKISPSVGIVIKPFGDNLSLYTSYVEGLAEGLNLNDVYYANDVNYNQTFAPYQTKQYEAGAKYQAGSWLNTLSVYQIEKPSLLTINFATADANGKTQMTSDDALTRSRGVEWSMAGNLTQDLSVLGNLAYIDSTYSKAAANQDNNVYGVPDFTAALGLDYAIPYMDGLNINARASYISKQYLNDSNTLELPAYTIVDMGARYKTKLGGVNTTLLVNVDNVTDKAYWEGAFNNNYAIIGGPRTYKLGVSFDF